MGADLPWVLAGLGQMSEPVFHLEGWDQCPPFTGAVPRCWVILAAWREEGLRLCLMVGHKMPGHAPFFISLLDGARGQVQDRRP